MSVGVFFLISLRKGMNNSKMGKAQIFQKRAVIKQSSFLYVFRGNKREKKGPNRFFVLVNLRFLQIFCIFAPSKTLKHMHSTFISYRWLLTVLLTFSLSISLVAESADSYSYCHYGVAEGLLNEYIDDIATDGDGFIWLATDKGFFRIAGQQCDKVKFADFSPNERSRKIIYKETWNSVIFAWKGLYIYHCDTHQLEHVGTDSGMLSMVVGDMVDAADGGVWILFETGDVQHYNRTGGLDRTITQLHNPSDQALCCLDDCNGRLYVGFRDSGLYCFNLSNGNVTHYGHTEGEDTSIGGNTIRTLLYDSRKNLWCGTQNGISLFDPTHGYFHNLNPAANDSYSSRGCIVYDLLETENHELWIAESRNGISILRDLDQLDLQHPETFEFEHLTPDNSQLRSTNVSCLAQDRYGHLCLGYLGNGIDLLYNNELPFHSLMDGQQTVTQIYDLDVDAHGDLWMSSENRLLHFCNGQWAESIDLGKGNPSLFGTIYNMKCDPHGWIWLGVMDDMPYIYHPATRQIVPYPLGGSLSDMLDIYVDPLDNSVWFGTGQGAWHCSDDNKQIVETLGKEDIHAIVRDRQGNMWFGTSRHGIRILDRESKEILRIDASRGVKGIINQIVFTPDNEGWVATSEGLLHFPDCDNPADFEILDHRHGLADINVRGLQLDHTGHLWMSTFSGISMWNKTKQRFDNFDHRDNVPVGSYIENSASISPDGTLYFGSLNGVCAFKPQHQWNREQTLNLHFTGFRVPSSANASAQPNPDIIPQTDGTIRLSYADNNLIVTFTETDVSKVGRVDYSYCLEPADDEWIFLESQNSVSLHDLSPGHYTLRIRGCLLNGDWDDVHILSLPIYVEPPFWMAWYAWVFYALLLVALMVMCGWWYRRRLRQQSRQEMTNRKHQLEQHLNEERLQFYTNITHELRTPLTLVLGPLEDLRREGGLSGEALNKLNLIYRNSTHLLQLVTRLLEFRRIETHHRKLSVSRGDLAAYVSGIFSHFREMSSISRLHFVLEMEEELPDIFFDREVIQIIIDNLLSNAMKYTEQGEIRMSVKREAQNLKIVVSDTGQGIDKPMLQHIFERYFRVSGQNMPVGTGIGLSLVKSLCDLHKADINVQSELGKGSTFTISLSINETYPSAIHVEETPSDVVDIAIADGNEKDALPSLLVVEDNADIRQYIASSCQSAYHVIEAVNGQDGIDKALTHIPDVIVSDIMMPVRNGIELCRTLKSDIRTCHIPVILLTAKDTLADKEEGYRSGADSYITKPFSSTLLLARLDNLQQSRHRMMERLLYASGSSSESKEDETTSLSALDSEFLDKLTGVIEENLQSEQLDIENLASRMNMSHSSFYRKVKGLTGVSAQEFVRKIRLRNCRRLLETGRYTVSEAAYMTGFTHMSHFRTCFKEEFGLLPSEVGRK